MQDYAPQPFVYNDPDNFNPEPPKEGNWLVQNRSLLIKVGIGVLVLIIISGTVIFLIQRSRANRLAAEQMREQNITTSQDNCQGVENEERCQQAVRPDLAEQTGDPSYCEGLSDISLDSCLTLAAITAQDFSICDDVSDSDRKNSCRDAALGAVPQAEKTYNDCSLFSTEKLQSDCQNTFVLKNILSGSCDSIFMSEEDCKIAEVFARALAADDPDICAELSETDYTVDCEETIGPGDRDHDGLSAFEEEKLGTDDRSVDSDNDGLSDADEVNKYQTNPANSDTDGDSYPDGVEVQSGYDPLH